MHAYYHYCWLFFRPNDGLVAKICKFGYLPFRDISHEELGLFLRYCEFLRFENVKLSYNYPGFQSIDKKCRLFVEHLKPLKAAFSDSTKIEFHARIGEGQNKFRDPLQLLNHLRNELLPICDSARRYKFTFYLISHEASTTAILEAILQMPQINFSTNVEFNFYQHRFFFTTIVARRCHFSLARSVQWCGYEVQAAAEDTTCIKSLPVCRWKCPRIVWTLQEGSFRQFFN